MNVSTVDIAKRLAERHLKIDDDVVEVYLIEDSEPKTGMDEEIRLLEIVEGTPEVGIQPLGFPPSPERGDLPLLIVEISPEEFRSYGGREMTFGDLDWRVTERLAARAA